MEVRVLSVLILSLILISSANALPQYRTDDFSGTIIYNNTYNITQIIQGGSFNETYNTWLPNYTAFNQFWYNQTSASSSSDLWNLSGVDLFPKSLGYMVGIGTASPASSLEVVGTFNVSNATQTTVILTNSAGQIGLGNGAIDTDYGVTIRAGANNTGAKIGLMAIGSSGSGYPVIGDNVRFSGTNGFFTYDRNDFAVLADFNGGDLLIKTAPSGTIGNQMTLTTVMSVKNGGSVGIGVASPRHVLDIQATSKEANMSLDAVSVGFDSILRLDRQSTNNIADIRFQDGGTDQWSVRSGSSFNDFTILESANTSLPRFIIRKANGLVGINTGSPIYQLDSRGNASLNSTLYVHNVGNVSIGKNSGSYKLDVLGGVRIDANGATSDLTFSNSANGNGVMMALSGVDLIVRGAGGGSTNIMTINRGGNMTIDTNLVTIDSSGNKVGIGTATPHNLLNVQSPSFASCVINVSSTSTNNNFSSCISESDFIVNNYLQSGGWARSIAKIRNATGGVYMSFGMFGNAQNMLYGYVGQGSSEWVDTWIRFYNGTNHTILNPIAGSVGIGTISPTQKLTVAGNIDFESDNQELFFGDANDASITYNATDMVFTQEVGSGDFFFAGGDIMPSIGSQRDIGKTNGRWANIFAVNITASNITTGDLIFSNGFRMIEPDSNTVCIINSTGHQKGCFNQGGYQAVAPISLLSNQTQPACSLQTRGQMWIDEGVFGVADAVQVCTKNALEVYAWRSISLV